MQYFHPVVLVLSRLLVMPETMGTALAMTTAVGMILTTLKRALKMRSFPILKMALREYLLIPQRWKLRLHLPRLRLNHR